MNARLHPLLYGPAVALALAACGSADTPVVADATAPAATPTPAPTLPTNQTTVTLEPRVDGYVLLPTPTAAPPAAPSPVVAPTPQPTAPSPVAAPLAPLPATLAPRLLYCNRSSAPAVPVVEPYVVSMTAYQVTFKYAGTKGIGDPDYGYLVGVLGYTQDAESFTRTEHPESTEWNLYRPVDYHTWLHYTHSGVIMGVGRTGGKAGQDIDCPLQ